jgi:hypothetical protein
MTRFMHNVRIIHMALKGIAIASICFAAGLSLGYLLFIAQIQESALIHPLTQSARAHVSSIQTLQELSSIPSYGIIERLDEEQDALFIRMRDPRQKNYTVRISIKGSRVFEILDQNPSPVFTQDSLQYARSSRKSLQQGAQVFLIGLTGGDSISADAIVAVRHHKTFFP